MILESNVWGLILLQDLIGWVSDSAYVCTRARNQARNEGGKPRKTEYALAHPFVRMIGFGDGDVIKVHCAELALIINFPVRCTCIRRGYFNPDVSSLVCAHDQHDNKSAIRLQKLILVLNPTKNIGVCPHCSTRICKILNIPKRVHVYVVRCFRLQQLNP